MNRQKDVPDLNIAHTEKELVNFSDVFNQKELDEMQKAYSFKAAFNCFKFLFWFVFAAAMGAFGLYVYTKQSAMMWFSYVLTAVWLGVFIYYTVKIASHGSMSEKLVRSFNKPSIAIFYTVALIIMVVVLVSGGIRENDDIKIRVIPLICALYVINPITSLCALKNQKVIEKNTSES